MEPFESKKALREHLTELTKELVRFPSHEKEPLKVFELIEFIKSYFANDSVNIKSHVIGGLPSLFITFEETKHVDILLSGHIDVALSSTKYMAEEKDGQLMGSGTMDMKGGVAVMMALLKYFSRVKSRPSLGLMITSDEEVGSPNGTQALLKDEGYRANFAVISEGREKYDLVLREKGILILKFTKKGPSVHSAYPWKTSNGIEVLMGLLTKIKRMVPKPADKWLPSVSVTYLHGGSEMNTIPGTAEAAVNFRLTGGDRWSRERITERVKEILPPDVEMTEVIYGEVFHQDPNHPYILMLREASKKVLGKKISVGENHGASDARFFMHHGIDTAILGPVGKFHHTANEYVEIDSLMNHFDVLKTFIQKAQVIREKPAQTLASA